MGGIRFGHHETAAGALVETVHNPRAGDAANASQLAVTMMQQGIDEGVRKITGGWMHNNSCRLIEDNQIGILIQYNQWNVFRQGRQWLRRRNIDGDLIAGPDPIAGLGRLIVDAHGAGRD